MWTIQFLIPWSEYIDLEEGIVMKEFKEGVFLEQTFFLTEGIVKLHQHYPHELILFWQGLSKGRPDKKGDNLRAIMNFLFKRGISSKAEMPVCKTIILFLFRTNPEGTLSEIIRNLSYAGVASAFDEISKVSEGEVLSCFFFF